MKVLQINTVCDSGSTGRIVADLYKVLIDNGHECLVGYGRGSAPEGINAIRIGNDLDMYLHALGTRITDKHGFYSKRVTEEFIEKVENYNPDIIHLHNVHGYYLNIEVLFDYLRKVKKPVVWTLHDCWPLTGHCAYFDYAGCNKWETGCFNCLQKKEYPKSIFFDNSESNYKNKKKIFNSISNIIFITPSNWMADQVKNSFVNNYNIKVIYNGIDLDVFKPIITNDDVKSAYKADYLLLGVANVWDERKGLNRFIELSKIIDRDCKILLIGLNEKQIQKLPSNIIGITKTKKIDELVKLYNAADIYINMSVEETMGLTTVEALACGTQSIVINSTAIPETISDYSGFIVQKNDIIQSVYSCIKYMRKNPKLSYDCREQAKKFTKQSMCDNYLTVYNGVMCIKDEYV